MKHFLVGILFLCVTYIYAQPGVIFTHAQQINEDRYEDYEGSPYQFKDWPVVNIYNASGLAFENMEFNYNGFSNEIEIRKDGRFVELDQIAYSKIESLDQSNKIVFKRGVNGMFQEKFVEVLYEGERYQFVRKFKAAVTEKEFNDVGKIILIKRFEPKFSYYIIRDGKLDEVKLKKKQILSYLGNKKLVDGFVSKLKLKITKPDDLKSVLEYLEEQH